MTRKARHRPKLAALTLLLMSLLGSAAFGWEKDWRAALNDDPVLAAMRDELDRARTSLKLDRVAAPYYIEYRIVDVDDYSAEASFGALRADLRFRTRVLRVVVRVGDYKQDGFSGRGERALSMADLMPVENDAIGLRHQLWLATDRAYREAAEALAAKQAQMKQFTIDQPVDDFAHAETVHSIGALAKLDFDPQPWPRMLEDASAVFRSDPRIATSGSNLKFEAVNQYFLNSEGTVVRSGRTLYEMTISCSTQASDGMSLQRNNGFVVENIKELPSATEFVARATKLAQTLKELRSAPVVDEEYRGPVLFSADAATSAFAVLVGENVLGRRPELGKTARTTGAFATSYKSRVLPDFLSVVDDPTSPSYRGQSLVGHYDIDDEGVPAQRVAVIDKGNLVSYLIGREPIRDFPVSNGHARARIPGNAPALTHAVPHVGNLIVNSSQTVSPEQLKKKLIELCQQRDLPYCYYVETFGPRLTPRLLYKVWAKDGHQELARGASFGDLDTRALRNNLIAAGDELYVENHPLNVPHSIAAPSILFDELEIKRATTNREKLPEYPAPALSSGK